jgi:uncharacterized protein YndB with AHSA1/START domain
MLIRRPVAEVFEAFVNPAITTSFWFTRSSGRLEVGRVVRWDWEIYGITVPVTAKTIEANKRIIIEWPGSNGPTTGAARAQRPVEPDRGSLSQGDRSPISARRGQ